MGLFPKQLEAVLAGMPWGPHSHAYIVDPQHGSDSNDGLRWSKPLLTLAAAENKCADNHNDVVLLVGGPTKNDLTEALTWDKSYTHLVGLTGDLPGVGQRGRITSATDAAIGVTITLSGNGCIFKNLNIQNENVADADSGALLVQGMRNYFKNCFISGMISSVPAARAAAYSMTVTGPENYFEDCAFGVATICRTAANAEVIFGPGNNVKRNHFRRCQFLSQSVTAGKVLARIAASTEIWQMTFEDCSWLNLDMTSGGADGASINHAIEDGATMHHQLFFKGLNTSIGCTQFIDVATYAWTHGAAVGGAVAPIALNNLTT
jgi:hypothetical protein